MGLEEGIKLVSGFEAEQSPQLMPGNMTTSEFLDSQGFEGAAGQVATGRAHSAGEIVRNLDGEFHALSPYSFPFSPVNWVVPERLFLPADH
jgi:hypothetical protein